MSALDDLIKKIPDENLRKIIDAEFRKILATKKFGLVFEEQKPEVTPLFDVPIKKNSLVAKKIKLDDVFKVLQIDGDNVTCAKFPPTDEIFNFSLNELVSVAMFGTAIYPYLQKLDEICNAPDSDLWHILIEADNYHALQLLQYTCSDRKVDCIYIDPPYNTGAKDWKYNNDYVDGADVYRHSKWLSMMQKRLKLAKKILNPDTGVLIVTIDDNELNTLGLLLNEIFSGYKIFCITIVHNPNGNQGKNFGITNEFAYFVLPTNNQILSLENRIDDPDIRPLRDVSGNSNLRTDARNCFYPIYVKNEKIVGFGEVCPDDFHPESANVKKSNGIIEVYPIDINGIEKKWVFARNTVESITNELFVEYNDRRKIFDIIRRKTHFTYKTVWTKKEFNANSYGSKLISKIFKSKRFDYPKSLYAVKECIAAVVANKPNALIVDFFAGSGTTMHAVNLLNAEDGGRRRCIMVTNNEVAESEEKNLIRAGFKPNDEEWQKLGVARYVTWARTVCSISGKNIHGEPLSGNYLGSEIPMADGFKANAAFFKLGFLNKNAVALGRQFKEILPVIWLKAGSFGKCPTVDEKLPPMLVLPENKFAVLIDERYFAEFEEKVLALPQIETVFIVTDSSDGYTAMIQNLRDRKTYQLYKDYLENFTINS